MNKLILVFGVLLIISGYGIAKEGYDNEIQSAEADAVKSTKLFPTYNPDIAGVNRSIQSLNDAQACASKIDADRKVFYRTFWFLKKDEIGPDYERASCFYNVF